jgi:tetratricopeptide (TPR) repeat protein
MLYSILPPMLVVLSLIGIILFLMKKAPRVANLEEEKKEKKVDILNQAVDVLLKEKNEEKAGKKFIHQMLLIGEKIMLRMKLIFLKLENRMAGWGESIRQKRKARGKNNEVNVLEKKEESVYRNEGEINEFFERNKSSKPLSAETEKTLPAKNETIQPLLNKKILMPQNKEQKKDLFEKILIERIAANPKDIEAYERLGEYYMEIKNWDYAKECFKQVMKLNPQNRNVKMKMRKLERLLQK